MHPVSRISNQKIAPPVVGKTLLSVLYYCETQHKYFYDAGQKRFFDNNLKEIGN